MGKRGPSKKPMAQKRLEGTVRKDRAPTNELKPKGQARPPLVLSEEAHKVWAEFSPHLISMGMLTSVDAPDFAIWCQAYADWLELSVLLNAKPKSAWTFTTATGYTAPIPQVAMRDKAWAIVKAIGPRFGMNPSARAGIEAPVPAGSDAEDEEFLFGTPQLA